MSDRNVDALDSALSATALGRLRVPVQVSLGGAVLPLSDIATIKKGQVIPLDRRVDEPVDILVNGQLFGRGLLSLTDQDNPRFVVVFTDLSARDASDAKA